MAPPRQKSAAPPKLRSAPPAKPVTIEQKLQQLRELEAQASPEQRREYNTRLSLSWIHHDCALEGVVYAPNELTAALSEDTPVDSSLAPAYDEIRQFQSAITLIRQMAEQKSLSITLDTVSDIYHTLAPEENEGKGAPKYRKDMPLHRAYFHDIDAPDKIAPKLRTLIQWLGSEEAKRTMHPTRMAAKAHYQLLQIFPFPKHSGKVGRLLMNLIVLREGYPPAILHATDRHRYYDALKTSFDAVSALTQEALENAVDSTTRYWHRVLGIEEESE